MKVKIKKLHEDAVIPKKAHSSDAGFDLTATSRSINRTGTIVSYGTGIAIEIPKNHVGLIFPRSSVYKKEISLSNSVGVVDHGYTGEIRFNFYIKGFGEYYEKGDRVGQLVIIPYPEVEFEEVEDLEDTERGNEGFGSTGN